MVNYRDGRQTRYCRPSQNPGVKTLRRIFYIERSEMYGLYSSDYMSQM